MKQCFLFVVVLLLSVSVSSTELGQVMDVAGKVTLHVEKSPRGERIEQIPQIILQDHKIRTYSNSKARIMLADGSKILLTEKATVDFSDERNVSVENGRVFFSINKRDAAKSLNIITKTAVIGVKGTRFMVEATEDSATVHLDEGVVEVETVAQFKEQLLSEFEAYKQQMNREFKEYKKVMTMTSGETITVGKSGALSLPTPDKLEQFYAELEAEF